LDRSTLKTFSITGILGCEQKGDIEMLTIIKEREHKEYTYARLEFDYLGIHGSGFTFPVTEDGEPDFDKMIHAGVANYNYCINHPEKFEKPEIRNYTGTFVDPAVGICSCGNQVELVAEYLGACSCPKCGKWYNIFGQELKDPEFWEEDY
jgi:hypothetical protein